MRAIFALFCCAIAALSSAWSADFYVHASGSDTNSGSQASPWKTIAKVNATTLNPGDSVNFNGGQTFTGTLNISQSGVNGNPITYRSYGTGRATLATTANTQQAVYVYNASGVSYVTVTGLNLLGTWTQTNKTTAVGNYSGLVLQGATNFISLSYMDISRFMANGIILMNATAASPRRGSSNLTVSYVTIHDNRGSGFICWNNPGADATKIHTNLMITDSTSYRNAGYKFVYDFTDFTGKGSGFELSLIDGGLLDRCVAYENGSEFDFPGGGPVGIWVFTSSNVTIQHCSSCRNTSTTIDGGGFDIDG